MKLFIQMIVLALTLPFTGINAQTAHSELRDGDINYVNQQFDKAEMNYRNAAVKDPSAQAKFNLGNSLYEQERYQEAAEEFQQAMNLSSDTMFRARALYNKGNSLLHEQKYGESLEAYKKSLLLNPKDDDVKRNFMFAMQKQQQEQQQQEQNQEQDEEQDKEESDQDKSPPSGEDEEQQQEDQPEQNEQQEQEQQEAQPEPQKKEMSREEAEQLLQIIENTDDFVQKKLKKQNSTKKQGEKNW